MQMFFPDSGVRRRMYDGPLGPYVDSYAAELRAQGYAEHSAIGQIRLVADFSRWLAKRRVNVRQLTATYWRSYLRCRAHVAILTQSRVVVRTLKFKVLAKSIKSEIWSGGAGCPFG